MFSLAPFKSIRDLEKTFPDEQACINHLEEIIWQGKPVSPFDETSKVYKCAGNKYKCKNTGKYFTVTTGTIFEGTKISLKDWFMAIYLFTSHKKGISSYQLAKDLDITQKSAWFMLHRLRYAFDHEVFKEDMGDEVQVDETFVGGKNKNRHHDKKVKNSQGRSFKDKTPILGVLDTEKKKVQCFVVADTSAGSIQPVLKSVVKPGALVISDDWLGYNGIEDTYRREVVEHGKKQYQNERGYSNNGIENFWTHFKRGWVSTYSGRITPKHLQKYADEFGFRYNFRANTTNQNFNLFLQGTAGRKLTYNTLTK